MKYSSFLRLGVCALAALLSALPLGAANEHDNGPAWYLALGDSVAFGYRPPPFLPADQYRGYPQWLAEMSPAKLKKLESLACPGETSASFLDTSAPDRGCQVWKRTVPLHTDYALLSQMEFALSELRTNKKIRLVTLNLGGNDLLQLGEICKLDPACIGAGLRPTIQNYAQNLARILGGIREYAGYTGQIVLLTYYSPDYRDPLQTGAVAALNAEAAGVAAQFDVTVADGFGAFLAASAPAGGDNCAAGLLYRLSATKCDEHPSALGQQVLAGAVLSVVAGK
jgi:lysophospholipase L1-like esterase